MQSFNTRVYSIADFLEWRTNNSLQLSAFFQRKPVWIRAAKSYLIDTILREKPMPKISLMQNLVDGKTMRTIVDGQQRIRSIFEFVDGNFAIFKTHNEEFARKHFDELPPEIQSRFREYEIGVDVLFDVNTRDLVDIFTRINTYTVSLNSQERLNAKYLGPFKTYAYDLGATYVDYFTQASVMSMAQVSRMSEARMASELLIVLWHAIQTNKTIEEFYREVELNLEDPPESLEIARDRVHEVMKYIGAIYEADKLKPTIWHRPHLFYSLFCVVAHALYGINRATPVPPKAKVSGTGRPVAALNHIRPVLSASNCGQWRVLLDEISANYDTYTENSDETVDDGLKKIDVPKSYLEFIDYSRRRTTDTEARVERAKFISDRMPKS